MKTPAIWLGAVLLCGCPSSTAELSINIKTDLLPFEEFHSIRIEVDEKPEVVAVRADRDYLLGARVHDDEYPTGERRVAATLLKQGQPVVTRSVFVQLESDRSVTILLTRECRDVVCDEQSSCLAGKCVPLDCTEDDSSKCPARNCDSCAPGVCGLASCEFDVCFRSDDRSCTEGLFCDPDIGCVPGGSIPTLDAGVDSSVDAPGPDVSSDATDAGDVSTTDASNADATADATIDQAVDATVDQAIDGTIDSTVDAITGDCINASDEIVLRPVDLQDAINTGTGCGQMFPNNRPGLLQCIAVEVPVSAMCLDCFADIVTCTISLCQTPCMSPLSQACTSCRAANCNGDFKACSGLEAM